MPQWWTTPQSTTTCSGGDPTPGTEGHLLRVVYAFLDESAAASATGATRVADVLDRR